MKQQRAQEIFAHCQQMAKGCPWSDFLDRQLSKKERRYISGLWRTMPGHTCFADAFLRIVNGDTLTIDKATEARKVYDSQGLQQLTDDFNALMRKLNEHRQRIATAKRHGLGENLLAVELLKEIGADLAKIETGIGNGLNYITFLTEGEQ